MTRHLFPRAHLPHPHIAGHLAEVFSAAVDRVLHRRPPIVPDGHDWPEFHWEHNDGLPWDIGGKGEK